MDASILLGVWGQDSVGFFPSEIREVPERSEALELGALGNSSWATWRHMPWETPCCNNKSKHALGLGRHVLTLLCPSARKRSS